MTSGSDRTPPSRRSPRLNHEVMASVSSEEHGSYSGWGTNLSQGGVFLNAQGAPPVGTRVSVLLQLPGAHECKLLGRVVWSQPAGPGVDEPGMGIEFLEVDEPTRSTVRQIVEKLAVDLSAAPA